MPEADRLLGMYLHLARASHLRLRPMVRDKLLVLPDDTVVLSGHGPASTIGQEKQMNPYVRLLDRILAGEIPI